MIEPNLRVCRTHNGQVMVSSDGWGSGNWQLVSEISERAVFVEPGCCGSCQANGGTVTLPLSELHDQAMERAQWRCEWAHCQVTHGLQLAHLEHRGRGGGEIRNTLANTAALCVLHHDILDGRTVAGRKYEVAVLLAAFLGITDTTEPRRHR